MARNQDGGFFEVSLYDDQLTKEVIVEMTLKIKSAFPTLPPGFFDTLQDRIKENGFTNQRLKDAVNHVIDNCVYPTPTVANFMSFDKKVKLYSHVDITYMLNDNPKAFEYYRPIKFNSAYPVYASLIDIEKYNLELAKIKNYAPK